MAEEKQKRMAIIASKGTLDMAYPPLILASTAAAMDVETMIFYTFYGVDMINKHKYASLQVAPIANPAMPSPVPMPNIIGMLPGIQYEPVNVNHPVFLANEGPGASFYAAAKVASEAFCWVLSPTRVTLPASPTLSTVSVSATGR